jgi:protein SCO1/2
MANRRALPAGLEGHKKIPMRVCFRIALCIAAAIPSAWGQAVDLSATQPPNEDLYIYRPVPDIRVQPAGQPARQLSALWAERPLLITLVFTRCAGVCYPFLRSLRSAAASVSEPPSGYSILVLSFDSRDSSTDLEAASAAIGAANDGRWIFATASQESIRRLSEATGFWFRWENARRQFDHPAVLLAVHRGRLARLFTGARISPSVFGGMLRELEGGFVASYPQAGNVLFRCFQYDPASGSFSLDWGALLLVVPGMIAFAAAWLTFHKVRAPRA